MKFTEAQRAVRAGAAPADVAKQVVDAMTPDERLWCVDGDAPTWAGLGFLSHNDGYHRMPFAAAEVDRLDMPGVHFADGPRGCVVGNATAFPVTMARGATWDPALEERVGDAIGRELRAVGADLTGAVCVNLLRHPAWGRAQETYGEDPHHVGELGAALTRGLQRHVMACVKHFACNSMENARFTVDVSVDEVALHEVYLPHFKRIVDEGVASVMTAYNSVNGEWCGESQSLIRDILRDEWGFDGFVISDWIFGLRDAATSMSAGLDIEMPYRMVRADQLRQAIESGSASWEDVDDAVTRVVATLLRFDEILSAPPPEPAVIGSDSHRALAREVAARSVVLLRNEPVEGSPLLPIRPDESVAVLGPLANRVNLGDGGSSDVWDLDCVTVLEGMRSGLAEVVYDDGTDLRRAASVAAEAGIAVIVVGFTHLDEGEYIGATDPSLRNLFPAADEPDVVEKYDDRLESQVATVKPEHLRERPKGFSIGGDRTDLRLADHDVALIRAVAAANPRTVVTIQAGSAVVVDDWLEDVPAIVQAWYGGCRAGHGLTDVLTGAVNPSARLPFSVPADEAHLPDFDRDATSFTYDRWHGWWHLAHHRHEPRFPFGFGLSYTEFRLDQTSATVLDDMLAVEAEVHNLGERGGAEVVQVYATLPDPDAPPRLVGFSRVEVAASGARTTSIEIPLDRLRTRSPDARAWQAGVGEFVVSVGKWAGDADAQHHHVNLDPMPIDERPR